MKNNLFKITSTFLFVLVCQLGFSQESVLKTLIDVISPIEISDLIAKQGIKYDKSLMNSPGNIASYQTDFKKALNLGVYSTDLGYATIIVDRNNKTEQADVLGSLGSLKKAAEGLGIGQFIDFSKIFPLIQDPSNLNKLLDETSSIFEKMSDYLESKNKSDIATLIVTGGWLETLFVTCEVAKKHPNAEINNRITQQKLILSQILEALKGYQSNKSIAGLTGDLKNLDTLLSKYDLDSELTANDVNKISGMVAEIRGAVIK